MKDLRSSITYRSIATMKVTTHVSYFVDRFPELAVDVSYDHKVCINGLEDTRLDIDDLFALAKVLTEIGEDSINQVTQWEVSGPDADFDEDDDKQLQFMFMFSEDEL
jgi:hypothetical protein